MDLNLGLLLQIDLVFHGQMDKPNWNLDVAQSKQQYFHYSKNVTIIVCFSSQTYNLQFVHPILKNVKGLEYKSFNISVCYELIQRLG